MPQTFRVGPCRVFYGTPTTAAGAGMVDCGYTSEDVVVSPNIGIAMGRVDQNGRTPRADAVFSVGPQPVARIPLVDETKSVLLKQVPGGAVVTASGKTALAFGSGFSQIAIADIGALCLVPLTETAVGTNGIDAPGAIWFPRAVFSEFGDLGFYLPDAGDFELRPHETLVTSLYYETDHGGATVPASARGMFMGPPAALGLTWFLPAAA